MSTSNYPAAQPSGKAPRRDSKNVIIGLMAVSTIGIWAYFFLGKKNDDQKVIQLQEQYLAVDSSKNELEKSFDASLSRLDSLTGYNNEIEGKLSARQAEIVKLKSQIRGIVSKQKITTVEKRRAKELIAELNSKIRNLEQEIFLLSAEKEAIVVERDSYRSEKDTLETAKKVLEEKVIVASTLNASGINILPINERKGGIEKLTRNAKKVDKLIIGFDVDNRIAETGSTEIYLIIIGPDGKPVYHETLDSGTFTTRDEGAKFYTVRFPVEIESGKKRHVEFTWKQPEDFKRGNYRVEVYHNGFKIGEVVKEMKKGIFG